MKNKSLAEAFHPRGEWVFFRLITKKSAILRLDGSEKKADEYEAQVISHGPGEYMNGTFVKVEGLPEGTIIVVPSSHCKQSKRWADEGLFVCPASSIIGTMDPMDDMDFGPVLVVPRPALVS